MIDYEVIHKNLRKHCTPFSCYIYIDIDIYFYVPDNTHLQRYQDKTN